MRGIWLPLISLCAVGVCFAQAPSTASPKTVKRHEADSSKGFCLLGSDCLSLSKTPVQACLVAKDVNARDACAVDGMKLIGKFETGERRS
jgi:hypothetical protein